MPSHELSLRFLLVGAVLLLTASTSLRAQKTETRTQPSGSISGQVLLGGKPAAGLPVVAIPGDTTNRRDTAARAVTDGQGYYRLSGLPPGQYQIWSLTPGLIEDSPLYPGYLPYGSTKNILLSANEDVANINLALISGAVISGRVVTTENKPVVDEQILLDLLDEHGNPRFGGPRSSGNDVYSTDDRGIYRIYGLPPGRYKVSVGEDLNQSIRGSSYPRTYYSQPDDPTKAAIVELKEGGEALDINIKVGERPSTFAVSGRIIDSTTDRPLPNVRYRIAVVQKDPRGGRSFIGMPTDVKGEFKFDGLRPGRYTISIWSDYNSGGNFYGEPLNFEILDRDVTDLQVKGIPGLTLSGAVVAEGLATRELLTLLTDLRIHAWPQTRDAGPSAGGGSSLVAADGTFQIVGLRPGRFAFDVSSMVRSWTRPTVSHVEREGSNVGRTIDLEQSLSGVIVVLSYGTGSIRGAVTFGGGAPPADARIFVNVRKEGSQEVMSVAADARGNFLIKNLAPGTYEVEPRLAFPGRGPAAGQTQKQTVTVANGSESEVSLLMDLGQPQGRP